MLKFKNFFHFFEIDDAFQKKNLFQYKKYVWENQIVQTVLFMWKEWT